MASPTAVQLLTRRELRKALDGYDQGAITEDEWRDRRAQLRLLLRLAAGRRP